MSFELYEDGFGNMQDAQATKPQAFRENDELDTDASREQTSDEHTPPLTLQEIAQRSYGNGTPIHQALEEIRKRGAIH